MSYFLRILTILCCEVFVGSLSVFLHILWTMADETAATALAPEKVVHTYPLIRVKFTNSLNVSLSSLI